MAEAAVINGKRGRNEALLNRLLTLLIVVLVLFLIGEIVVQLFVFPKLIVKHVYITTDVQLSKEVILETAGLNTTVHYFNLNAKEIERKISELPLVKGVEVSKKFPDSVRVTIRGRKPLLTAFVTIDGRTVPVTMDEEGVIYYIGPLESEDVPIISGLVFKGIKLGTRVPRRIMPLLEDLYVLKNNDPELFKIISEIKIVPVNDFDYELVLYPISYNIKVRLGKRLDSKNLKYIIMVLDLLSKDIDDRKLEEVDFRSGTMVYKIRRD